MAATAFQIPAEVFYIGSYGPKKARILRTSSIDTDDTQTNIYYLEGEGERIFAEEDLAETAEDLITLFETKTGEL